MEERDVLVAARLGVRYPRQAEELEPDGVAPLAPVHTQRYHISCPIDGALFLLQGSVSPSRGQDRWIYGIPVHVVAKGEDDLQHPLESLAPLDFFGTLEHRLKSIAISTLTHIFCWPHIKFDFNLNFVESTQVMYSVPSQYSDHTYGLMPTKASN